MPQLPVDAKILQDALVQTSTGGFIVTATEIRMNTDVFWTAEAGIDSDVARSYPSLMACITHVLKSRRWCDLRGWMEDLTAVQRAAERKVNMNACQSQHVVWPSDAETGAEYVEACAWYDRVEAELADKGVAPCTHDGLIAALEKATPRALSDVSLVRALVSMHVPACVEIVVEANAEDSRQYDIILSSGVSTETVHWPIPDGATGCIGDRFTPPADEGIRKAAKSLAEIVVRLATEQPWEKQARVAASAGYVHAHPAPALSGMRMDNGWAVSGFAVTDAVAQDRPAWTLADKQGAPIVGVVEWSKLSAKAWSVTIEV